MWKRKKEKTNKGKISIQQKNTPKFKQHPCDITADNGEAKVLE